MKFWSPILAGATLLSAVSAQVHGSDIVLAAVYQISNATKKLGDGVVAFQGDATAAVNLLSISTDLLTVIQNGTANITRAANIRSVDALSLAQPIIDLGVVVNMTVQAVVNQKPAFVKIQLGSIVLKTLQDQECASQQFTNATTARLPQGGLERVAARLAEPILTTIARGIAAYGDQTSISAGNCTRIDGTGYVLHPTNAAPSLSASNGILVALAATLAMVMLA